MVIFTHPRVYSAAITQTRSNIIVRTSGSRWATQDFSVGKEYNLTKFIHIAYDISKKNVVPSM